MVMAGLLWYDDDARRPLAAKIIEATERYRDRIGFAPTVCQLPPQQLKALTEAPTSHRKRARTPVIELPRKLRLEPDERLHPNTFLLGMGDEDIAIPNPLLAEDDQTRQRTRPTRQPRPAKATPKAAAPVRPPQSPPTKGARTPVATQPEKPTAAKAPTSKPNVASEVDKTADKPVSVKTRATKLVRSTPPLQPAETAVKRSATVKTATKVKAAKKVTLVAAKQATLWDITPAATTRAKTSAKPVEATSKKAEKVARIAKPAMPEKGRLAKAAPPSKATKVAKVAKDITPTRSTAGKAAKAATKPVTKATTPAKAPVVKPAKPATSVASDRRATQTIARVTNATEKAVEKPARGVKAVETMPTPAAESVAKKATVTTHATITSAARAKPKATSKPTVKKAAAARSTRAPQAPSEPGAPRRRLAKSA